MGGFTSRVDFGILEVRFGNLFGLTYSAVSHNVTEIKKKIRTDIF
jgi:hypothetical protein